MGEEVLRLIKATWHLSQSSCDLYVPESPIPRQGLSFSSSSTLSILLTLAQSYQLPSGEIVWKEDPTRVLLEPRS